MARSGSRNSALSCIGISLTGCPVVLLESTTRLISNDLAFTKLRFPTWWSDNSAMNSDFNKSYPCLMPVLRSTRKYYPSTVPYYSVLQSAAPVLLITTHYCSSTTLYYKVLLRTIKYYSTLQNTTPLLLCTTKNHQYYSVLHSSTALYYKEPLQYYSTKYYKT